MLVNPIFRTFEKPEGISDEDFHSIVDYLVPYKGVTGITVLGDSHFYEAPPEQGWERCYLHTGTYIPNLYEAGDIVDGHVDLHGLCDTPQQVLKLYIKLLDRKDLNFCVNFHGFEVSTNTKWWKAGRYITTNNDPPNGEYLLFHINPVKTYFGKPATVQEVIRQLNGVWEK